MAIGRGVFDDVSHTVLKNQLVVLGFLNINKPAGITSRNVVDDVLRYLKQNTSEKIKAGHAGTLDPIASGVLVLAIGGANRLIQFLHGFKKRYRAEFLLGHESDSDDVENEVRINDSAPIPDLDTIKEHLQQQIGIQEQVPPRYSAVKVDGKRAYQLARRGQSVALKARSIQIFECRLVDYEYPRLVIDVECSAGTYIRSLGRDLARAMNTSAVMSNLTRTQHGVFSLEDSIDLAKVNASELITHLVDGPAAFPETNTFVLSRQQEIELLHGRTIDASIIGEQYQQSFALTGDNQLAALVEQKNGLLYPTINFLPTMKK